MPGIKSPYDQWQLYTCKQCENHYLADPTVAEPKCPRDKNPLSPVAPEDAANFFARYNWICAGCGVLRQLERRHGNPCALCDAPIFERLKEEVPE